MKKFTDFANNGNKIEKVKTAKQLLESLVDDTLSIENGVIMGKDTLIETINKMIEMNDHKTTIKVLENVRAKTYRGGLDFTWLNETIDNEDAAMNEIITRKAELIVENVEPIIILEPIMESVEIKEEVELVEEANEVDIINENIWNEVVSGANQLGGFEQIVYWVGMGIGLTSAATLVGSMGTLAVKGSIEALKDAKLGEKGKEFINDLKAVYNKIKGNKNKVNKEEVATEIKSIIGENSEIIADLKAGKLGKEGKDYAKVLDKIESSATEVVKEEETIKESSLIRGYQDQYMSEINTISSLYGQIILENHLTAKKDRINFILDNSDECTEEELREMSDFEIEEKYKNIENK